MELRIPEEADRDFTSGAFIVKDHKVLLIYHKKLDFWVQPGGHIEKRETPDEAAIRETKEETGLEVEIVEDFIPDTDYGRAADLPKPFNVNLHPISEAHYHCDFQYLARVKDTSESSEYAEEDMRWFSRKDLKSKDLKIPENARETALKALKTV